MTELLFHVAGGVVFLLLAFCLLGLLAAGLFFRGEAAGRYLHGMELLVAAGVLVSAPPVPSGLLPLWAILVFATLVQGYWLGRRGRWVTGVAGGLLALATCGLILLEVPYLRMPQVSVPDSIHVVGDSLSAGIGREHSTWPGLLSENTGLAVTSAAVPGARLANGIDQLQSVDGGTTLVVVLLGGNDVLLRRPRAEFDRDLHALLSHLAETPYPAVMFELPVVAGYRPYGRIQRRLAREYEIPLIPANVLARVLSAPGGTSDGIHLTDRGHRDLADRVAGMLASD